MPKDGLGFLRNGSTPIYGDSEIWLDNIEYRTVLHATRTVAFEYDPANGKQRFSPNITELVAGNYDGRFLSNVMLEDGAIYPEDVELSLRFRDKVKAGSASEMTLRLLTPQSQYRWFRMGIYPCTREGRSIYVGVLVDVDDEVRQRELLRYRAEYDTVSGIFNKSTFYAATDKLLSEQPEVPHYLIRFDIDRFKIVNELYGSQEGDRVLRFIGDLLRELVKPGETFGRLDNDVYGLCLSRSRDEVLAFIRDLEQQVNTYPLDCPLVISAGILLISRHDGQPVPILCDRAAIAQRRVKGSFIYRYAFYEDWMGDELNKEHYILGGMRRALEERQFCMYLQPKYQISDSRIVGAEALVRWNHPPDGVIPPSEFIPMFERNGFILQLDEYIWEEACRTIRDWTDRGIIPLPISVNVSRMHLYDPSFCDKLVAMVNRYRLEPAMLELEITESAYIENPQALYEIMEKLQKMGFLFAMDDFGSGYSSLNSLKDIPVDLIKLDLNFLTEARRGRETGRSILKDTVTLIRNMGLTVIAEGVEDEEQVNLLKKLHCNLAQGYYYAKPMPVKQFEELLRRQMEEYEK